MAGSDSRVVVAREREDRASDGDGEVVVDDEMAELADDDVDEAAAGGAESCDVSASASVVGFSAVAPDEETED